jgi:hypothetical protein
VDTAELKDGTMKKQPFFRLALTHLKIGVSTTEKVDDLDPHTGVFHFAQQIRRHFTSPVDTTLKTRNVTVGQFQLHKHQSPRFINNKRLDTQTGTGNIGRKTNLGWNFGSIEDT